MINFEEQLLMAYGGLRGAIAFSLAIMLEENHVKHARIFITTSLFIVLFTVFVLGSTTKPVVRWLEVQLHVHYETSMFIEINNKVVETVMSGIEEVAGHRSVNYWSQKLHRFNEKYLKSILTRGDGHSFKDTFELIYSGFIPVKPSKAAEAMESNDEDQNIDYNMFYSLATDRRRSNTNDSKNQESSELTEQDIIQLEVPIGKQSNDLLLSGGLATVDTGHGEVYLLHPSSKLPILTTSPSSSSLVRNITTTSFTTGSSRSIDQKGEGKVKIKVDTGDPEQPAKSTKRVQLLHPDSYSGSDGGSQAITSTSTPSLVATSPSKASRVTTDEDLSDLERRFIASAFSRSAYYQLPERDEIDEERAERIQQHHHHQSSLHQKLPYFTRGQSGLSSSPCLPLLAIDASRLSKSKNKWTSAKFKLEKLAVAETTHATTHSESSLPSTSSSSKITMKPVTKESDGHSPGPTGDVHHFSSSSSYPHLQTLDQQGQDGQSLSPPPQSPDGDLGAGGSTASLESGESGPLARLSVDLREELEPLRKILLSKRKSSAFAEVAETALLAKRWQEQQDSLTGSQGATGELTKDHQEQSDHDIQDDDHDTQHPPSREEP